MNGGQVARRRGRWWSTLVLVLGALSLLAGCTTPKQPVATAPGKPGHGQTQQPALRCGGDSGRACQLSLFATEPDDGVKSLTARFDAATTSIDYVPFLLDQNAIVKSLIAARNRGVHVRVMTEPENANKTNKAVVALTEAGAEIHDADPAFSLTHSKYVVVDGKKALLLTYNSTNKELPTRRDFAMEDDDPEDVRFVQALFDADWTRTPVGPIPPGFVLSPDNADETLPALVRSAQTSVDVYAEKLQSGPLLAAIEDTAKRGIPVRILAAPDDKSVPKPLLTMIRTGQIKILVPTAFTVHAKVLVVDGSVAYFGSQNIEDAVGDRRRELGLMFADPAAVGHLNDVFARDWAGPTTSFE